MIGVDWEITKRCNETCSFCLNASGPTEADVLSTAGCLRIIDELVELGVFHMVITGGEPFVRDDLPEILEYAARKNLIWTITTNGSLLSRGLLERLAPLRAHFRSLQVSLHSLDSATYDRYRIGRREHAATQQGIQDAVALGFSTTVICLFNGKNAEEVLSVYDWCASVGVYGFISSTIKRSGRAQVDYEGFRSELGGWMDLLQALFNRADSRGNPKILISEPPLLQKYANKKLSTSLLKYSCPAGKETFMIKGNGDVYACLFISHDCTGRVESEKMVAGNIREASLSQLLRAPTMQAFNANVDSATTFYGVLDTKCSGCGEKRSGSCRPCQLGLSSCHDTVRVMTDILKPPQLMRP